MHVILFPIILIFICIFPIILVVIVLIAITIFPIILFPIILIIAFPVVLFNILFHATLLVNICSRCGLTSTPIRKTHGIGNNVSIFIVINIGEAHRIIEFLIAQCLNIRIGDKSLERRILISTINL